MDLTDPSHGPSRRSPIPIPRVILATGIKAIADSSIATSYKKFADQVHLEEGAGACLVVLEKVKR